MSELRWFGEENVKDVRAAIRHALRRSRRCDNDVDDLVQTSLLRFLCALRDGRIDQEANVGGYLATIARNAAHDWLVARSREKHLREAGNAVDRGAPVPDPADLHALHRYLRQLPSDLASVYEMRFGGELSQLQVALKLKLSRQQVRTLESRLLREGQRALRADSPEPQK
ncbi:MAG TPA: sigma-70 family RNA polymerase sigma factor [Polyangia bacterium]|nr:sigma-70 family RNA polymerase sigma factor [Polyangia bacterium]